MSKFAKRKDTNHNDIVDDLRAVGAVVKETYQHPGMLDVIVGYRSELFWADIKYRGGGLTDAERLLIEDFAKVGITLHIWRTANEALKTIGAIE